MFAWRFIKRLQRCKDPAQSKHLLAGHQNASAPGSAGDYREGVVGSRLGVSRSTGGVSRIAGDQAQSGIFGLLEKKREKRMFYNYLYRFELTQEQLGSLASRQILGEIHRLSHAIAYRFDEPVSNSSHHVLKAAAWGTIYCLLGPTRMLEMAPDYREIADEVEMELLASDPEDESDSSIYRRVFTILSDTTGCHSEVLTLIDVCIGISDTRAS